MPRSRRSPFLHRVDRAFARLPGWLKPAVVGAVVISALMGWRMWQAVPDLLAGRVPSAGIVTAPAAAAGAAFLGGLAFGVTRPALRCLGRPGDYLSGLVLMWGYLGALAAASPWIFESSAIPTDLSGALIGAGLVTLLGLVAGHTWFGEHGVEPPPRRGAEPLTDELESEDGARRAVLVAAWLRPADLVPVCEAVAAATGTRLAPDEGARLASAALALVDEPEDAPEVEGRLEGAVPVPLHVVEEDELLQLEFLLEGEQRERCADVVAALARHSVDPLAA